MGTEIRKPRPAVIVSNDISNEHLDRVQVVPVSSNVTVLYPSDAFITVRGEKRKAMANQIATVSKARLAKKIGSLGWSDMQAVEDALLLQLGFSRPR